VCLILICRLSSAAAIATAAAQYDLTPGYGYPTTIMEDYSSKGRTPIFFDAQGNRFPVARLYQKPDITGPDGLVSKGGCVAPLYLLYELRCIAMR
jgi:hypothetical protein